MRGNTFSRNHTTFDTCSKCSDFWSYGFDEGGSKDYPAVVDHILAETSVEYMYFFGHSMGTTQFTVGRILKINHQNLFPGRNKGYELLKIVGQRFEKAN